MSNRQCHIARPPGRSGFTITEVLIVVAILALLVAVLIGVSSFINTHKNNALTENCLDILDAALAEFHDITGHYPIDEDDWDDRGTLPGCLLKGASSPGAPASDELLYLQLSLLPPTRAIIAKLPGQLITAPLNSAAVQLADDPSSDTPYLRSIVDPWHTEDDPRPLHYERNGDNFPKIWSYGPDDVSDTEDDITNEN